MNPLTTAQRFPLGLGALVSALGLVLPAASQVTPYGSGINPPGSLVVTSGVPTVGQSFNLGVSNTATSSAPASFAFLAIATAPDPAFPAGTSLPGFGLSAPGAPGELLISLVPPNPFNFFGPISWAGGTAAPANFVIAVPPNPGLSGATFYLQGLLVDPSSGPSFGLTNALQITLGGGPIPGVTQIPGLAVIQPGTFQMGSDAVGGQPYFGQVEEKPVHTVTISKPFWMGTTEVTQAQYQALMGTNPSLFVGPSLPVERVNWFGARAYCAALTAQQAALGNVPTGYEYRLPTEAEWEYACRAGTTTEYNVGSALFCNQAKFLYSFHSNSLCSSNSTVPVGSYPPNAWGLHDMHGNVWEWCLDSYFFYPSVPVTDPFVTGGPFRIVRGGNWADQSQFCRSAYRYYINPVLAVEIYGFRVVLAPIIVP
jgi:formylglycine-generating enzyme required for sulfatase activity